MLRCEHALHERRLTRARLTHNQQQKMGQQLILDSVLVALHIHIELQTRRGRKFGVMLGDFFHFLFKVDLFGTTTTTCRVSLFVRLRVRQGSWITLMQVYRHFRDTRLFADLLDFFSHCLLFGGVQAARNWINSLPFSTSTTRFPRLSGIVPLSYHLIIISFINARNRSR